MSEHQEIDKAVRLAVERVLSKGPDDVFRPPSFSSSIEHEVIVANADDFRAEAIRYAKKFINQGQFNSANIGSIFKVQTAKDEYSVRHCSLIDPFDAVSYLALAYIIFPKIELNRPCKSLNIIHSHRMGDGDEVFDENYGYDSFRRRSAELSEIYNRKWKVITDISNFFDRIGNHPLENMLLSIGVEEKYVKTTKDLLLHWSEGRRSFGVPVGGDASRIISEAALIDVDKHLEISKITYCRYVDDYRIFSDTKAEALKALSILTDALYEEGLFLNSKKTSVIKIIDSSQIVEHVQNENISSHDPVDMDEKVEVRRAIRVSGRSSISRYYREPGKEYIEKLKKITKEDIVNSIISDDKNNFETNVKQAVKYFLYVDSDVRILSVLIDEKVTTIFYIVDALIKEANKFDEGQREAIKNTVMNSMEWINCPYHIQLAIVRLLGSDEYGDEEYINNSIMGYRSVDSQVFFRELISLGMRRIKIKTLRHLANNVFNASPAFVQRSIYKAVLKHPLLSDEQRAPLIRNLTGGNKDWYITRIA